MDSAFGLAVAGVFLTDFSDSIADQHIQLHYLDFVMTMGTDTPQQLDEDIARMNADPSRAQMLAAFALVRAIAGHEDTIETLPPTDQLRRLAEIERRATAISSRERSPR